MKIFLLFMMAAVLTLYTGTGCSGNTEEASFSTPDGTLVESYDARMAEELGADEYGMRRYVIAFLKAGPNRDHDQETAMELQRAHMDNINRMAEEGSLVVAGPFLDNGQIRGIYIFDVESIEEARELTETDPAVQAGRLEMELHPWYGSAALRKVNEIHSRISREKP